MTVKRGTLDKQRASIKRKYMRGRKVEKVLKGEGAFSVVELSCAKLSAVYLKAAGFSHAYIGEAVGVSKDTVTRWFSDAEMQRQYEEVHNDYVDGAVKLLKTYALEAVEMLMELARSATDERVALNAITEVLDRTGLSKVNKSESAVVTESKVKEEVSLTDPQGIVAKMRAAPPEVQAKMAEHAEAMMALASEHIEAT